jgi:hypothetical protein
MVSLALGDEAFGGLDPRRETTELVLDEHDTPFDGLGQLVVGRTEHAAHPWWRCGTQRCLLALSAPEPTQLVTEVFLVATQCAQLVPSPEQGEVRGLAL